jgi:hypothetical protein
VSAAAATADVELGATGRTAETNIPKRLDRRSRMSSGGRQVAHATK